MLSPAAVNHHSISFTCPSHSLCSKAPSHDGKSRLGRFFVNAVAAEPASVPSTLSLNVETATSPSLFRAAATLRSQSFYSYPVDRSPTSSERHRAMRIQDECRAMQQKSMGKEIGFRQVACLVALCDVGHLSQGSTELSRHCQVGEEGGQQQWVVGTLDLNLGIRLPGEELIGLFPQEGTNVELRRAYLSNVCVATCAQRRGVAARLLKDAMEMAEDWGVEDLYVHVVAENLPAKQLYEKCGFVLEQQETSATAHALNRQRRLLLRTTLQPSMRS